MTTHPSELVVNWHVTEACNYDCRYCYAKWHAEAKDKELIHDADASHALLAEIYRQFAPEPDNHARLGMKWEALRLSLAGGEPLLYSEKIIRIARQAQAIGFKVSLITNGSRLTLPLMRELAPVLSVLGLSIDSTNDSTNRSIGRADRHEDVLALSGLAGIIKHGQQLNPELRLKINTVVNTLNCTENMSSLIEQLAPDKWKVLRMLPTITDDLAITEQEFTQFVERHQKLGNILSAEDNSDMVESYIMIDPHGRFFQNSLIDGGYRYSQPILKLGAHAAFHEVQWQPRKFQARYALDFRESTDAYTHLPITLL